jgi:hypothetical protein
LLGSWNTKQKLQVNELSVLILDYILRNAPNAEIFRIVTGTIVLTIVSVVFRYMLILMPLEILLKQVYFA